VAATLIAVLELSSLIKMSNPPLAPRVVVARLPLLDERGGRSEFCAAPCLIADSSS
jgi:hypothetical protein